MDNFAEAIGFTAAFLGAIHMIPQVVKSFKTKQVKDVSFYMIFIYFLCTGLWAIYGYMIGSLPVLIGDGFNFIVTTVQLVLKLRYERNG